MALMGTPPRRKVNPLDQQAVPSAAITQGRSLMGRNPGVRGGNAAAFGFNVDFVQTPNGPQRVPSHTQPANAVPMLARPRARVSDTWNSRRTPAQQVAPAQQTSQTLAVEQPSETILPTTSAATEVVQPPTGLPTSTTTIPPTVPPPTAGSGTYNGTSNTGNTTPRSDPTGENPDIEANVPGSTGPVTQQREDDLANFLMQLFYERDGQLGGSRGPGGNNIASDGSYALPSFIQGLMERYNSGANTDAQTRAVGTDETVEGRLTGLMGRDNPLNRMAMQDAREQAAAAGLIGGSSGAAGAALRASRQAMLPIAQQDAQTYGATARDNMDAVNRDRLSDQDLRSGLIGQEANLAANLYESASDRQWRSKEANHERIWKSLESRLGWLRQSVDREDQQDFAGYTREDEQHWNAWQNDLQREFQRWSQNDDQEFQGTENERNRLQERSMAYFNMAFGREGLMAQGLAAIYSNPNLTPAQQQAAAQNYSNLMRDVWASFNATFAQGIPNIFRNPTGAPGSGGLPGPGGTGTGNGTTPPPPPPPPPNPPAEGAGQWGPYNGANTEAPILSRDSANRPTRAIWGGLDPDGYPIWQWYAGGPRVQFDAQGNPIPYNGG
jgi:hypothetical protein